MPGIRLDGGALGCPPTETPVEEYKNPFRVDGSGAFWMKQCFPSFMYFGEARHDLLSPVAPGSEEVPVTTFADAAAGKGITAGRVTTRTITNTTSTPIGILLAHNIVADLSFKEGNWVMLTVTEQWNGQYHASATVSSRNRMYSSQLVRKYLSSGANPHDLWAPDGGAGLRIEPGASASVSCKLSLQYAVGAPTPGEMINGLNTAVRIYGYVIV